MTKKLAEWNRMVDAKVENERVQSYDLFRKFSRDELDLAEKTFSRAAPGAAAPQSPAAHAPGELADFAGMTKGDGKIQYAKFPVGGGAASWLAKSARAQSSKTHFLDAPSNIDEKVKLLSQLESARCVLQNHPGGSTSSMDDEVRSRLRKINRVQMQVIDEILGSKAEMTSEFVSELLPEKFDGRRLDGLRRGTDVEERRADKFKASRDTRRIILELPRSNQNTTRDVTISIPRVDDDDSPGDGVCTGTTDLCPKPSRKRSELGRRSLGRLPFDGSYGPPPHMHYEHHFNLYGGRNMPHYHQDMPSPAPSQDVYYPPAALPTANYATFHSQCLMHNSSFPPNPPNLSAVAQGGYGLGHGVSHVGVDAGGADDDEDDDDDDDADSKNPSVVSRTIIILNGPEETGNTEVFRPVEQPAQQQVQLRAQEMAVQAGQDAGMQLSTVGMAAATQQATVTPSSRRSPSPRGARNTAADERFAKSCRESLREIADSVDDIIASLSSSDYQPDARRRSRRAADYDYDEESSYDENDDYSDYEDPPRRSRRDRSRPKAPQRRHSSVESKQGTSFWSWLCRGLRSIRDKSPCSRSKKDEQLIEVADRIRELVQKVVSASNDVINARNAIQQGGLQGQMGLESVLSTEKKLWELIEIERDLANELAQYKVLDSSSDSAYIESLNQAEEKIKRLIEVETQLASEIGAWRQMAQQVPYSTSYTRTTVYRPPSSSSDSSQARTNLFARSSTSVGYMS